MNNLKTQVNTILTQHYFKQCNNIADCFNMCPIDSVKIATSLGIEIYARGGENDVDYPYSGSCREYQGKLIIEFNQDENSFRQRMVVAYALGLFFFHKKEFISKEFIFNQKSEVLDFANELILPTSLLTYYLENAKIKEVEQVARRFGVSKDKMGWRMIELGLV
jgi:Zn-dependent peptidase ImmA (M78 family)